jgi:excinuclease UvrABC ATPase subunit
MFDITSGMKLALQTHDIEIVVDRMVVNPRQIMKRLSESINTAASW